MKIIHKKLNFAKIYQKMPGKSLTKIFWNIEVWAVQKHVNLVDLVKSFPTNIFLQNLASIQKRTSPIKFAHLAEKSENGSVKEPFQLRVEQKYSPRCLSQCDRTTSSSQTSTSPVSGSRRRPLRRHQEGSVRQKARPSSKVSTLVERFDIEPFPDFSAK